MKRRLHTRAHCFVLKGGNDRGGLMMRYFLGMTGPVEDPYGAGYPRQGIPNHLGRRKQAAMFDAFGDTYDNMVRANPRTDFSHHRTHDLTGNGYDDNLDIPHGLRETRGDYHIGGNARLGQIRSITTGIA
jgi:hypothetical protein